MAFKVETLLALVCPLGSDFDSRTLTVGLPFKSCGRGIEGWL